MAKKNDYTGDGLKLYKALWDKGYSVKAAIEKLNISRGTLYNYYESDKLDSEVKKELSKSLSSTEEEIFGIKYNEEENSQGIGIDVKESTAKEVITIGKHTYTRLTPEQYAAAYGDWQGVPMYNVPVTASFVETYRDHSVHHPSYYLHDPRFKDCKFGAIITGDSMHSEIRHGDYVICQEILDWTFVVYGDIYYVVSTNGLETCKYINADPDNRDNYLLVPRNDSISPSPIPKKMILKMFKVRGVLRGY